MNWWSDCSKTTLARAACGSHTPIQFYTNYLKVFTTYFLYLITYYIHVYEGMYHVQVSRILVYVYHTHKQVHTHECAHVVCVPPLLADYLYVASEHSGRWIRKKGISIPFAAGGRGPAAAAAWRDVVQST